jgi:hypothetical protein
MLNVETLPDRDRRSNFGGSLAPQMLSKAALEAVKTSHPAMDDPRVRSRRWRARERNLCPTAQAARW